MDGRTAFTIAAVGAGIYVLYKNACKRAQQMKENRDAKADWENEGGAAVEARSSPA
jgi:hypothetical protein